MQLRNSYIKPGPSFKLQHRHRLIRANIYYSTYSGVGVRFASADPPSFGELLCASLRLGRPTIAQPNQSIALHYLAIGEAFPQKLGSSPLHSDANAFLCDVRPGTRKSIALERCALQ